MRVAIVAGPDPGHAFPAVALALRLHENNDEPAVFTGDRWLPQLQALGLPAEEIPGTDALPADQRDVDPAVRLDDRAARLAPLLAERISAFRPDVVVSDVLMLTGGMAAELVDVPWVRLHPHPLTFPSAELPSGSQPASRAPHRSGLRARVSTSGRRRHASGTDARASIGLPRHPQRPRIELVATLPGLEPPQPDWPRDASVVGPLIWDPATEDLQLPAGTDPLVLVSPSTAATGKDGLLSAALEGLHDVRLAGTVLDPFDEALPSWASIGPGRQEPVIERASVVVSRGGHGMLVRSLLAGVPLVLAPESSQQAELARRAEALGVALVLRRITPERLGRAVAEVIEDRSYASAARQVAQTAAAADPVALLHQSLVSRALH